MTSILFTLNTKGMDTRVIYLEDISDREEWICVFNTYDMDILIEQGMDLDNTYDKEWSFLIFASILDYTDMLELLLQHGANPNIPNIRKETPLSVAKKHNNIKGMDLLIQYGATHISPDLKDE